MLHHDRELLARLARLNRHLGAVVVELLHHQHDGELPADGLTALADRFADLTTELRTRAAERDNTAALTGPDPVTFTRPSLPPRQWHALDDLLAEMCERTRGDLEDLHDRGRGILETCRPHRPEPPADDPNGLRRHLHRVVGALSHLDEAAPGDTRAIRTTGHDVARLARRMLTHPRHRPHAD
ncbi:hypothetical protein [Saccharomonospora iraqiensis]|uniref:hypothetical protein n=1 Tax=Saccharomonospora iraqiensis TaxID=52698 RepID=UPI00022E0EAF|nr:hypothetical protein [Saccharomonospora iraqiensis]